MQESLRIRAQTPAEADEWRAALLATGWLVEGDPSWRGSAADQVPTSSTQAASVVVHSGELRAERHARWVDFDVSTLRSDGRLRLERDFGGARRRDYAAFADVASGERWCVDARGDGLEVTPSQAFLRPHDASDRCMFLLIQHAAGMVRSARSPPLCSRGRNPGAMSVSPGARLLAFERNAVRAQRRLVRRGSPTKDGSSTDIDAAHMTPKALRSARLAALRAKNAMRSLERSQAWSTLTSRVVDEDSLGASSSEAEEEEEEEAEDHDVNVAEASDDSLDDGRAHEAVALRRRAVELETTLAAATRAMEELRRSSATQIALLESKNATLRAQLRAAQLEVRNAALEAQVTMVELEAKVAAAAGAQLAKSDFDAAAGGEEGGGGSLKAIAKTKARPARRFSLRALLPRSSSSRTSGHDGERANAGAQRESLSSPRGATVNPAFLALRAPPPPPSPPLGAPPPLTQPSAPRTPPPRTPPQTPSPRNEDELSSERGGERARERMVARVRAASLLKKRLVKLRRKNVREEKKRGEREREARWHEARRPRPKNGRGVRLAWSKTLE